MVVISHVLRFSPLLSVLLDFRLISSEEDELTGLSDSFSASYFVENFSCR